MCAYKKICAYNRTLPIFKILRYFFKTMMASVPLIKHKINTKASPLSGALAFSSCQKQSPESGGAFCIPWTDSLFLAPTTTKRDSNNIILMEMIKGHNLSEVLVMQLSLIPLTLSSPISLYKLLCTQCSLLN